MFILGRTSGFSPLPGPASRLTGVFLFGWSLSWLLGVRCRNSRMHNLHPGSHLVSFLSGWLELPPGMLEFSPIWLETVSGWLESPLDGWSSFLAGWSHEVWGMRRQVPGLGCRKSRIHSVHPGPHLCFFLRLAGGAPWLAGVSLRLAVICAWLARVSSWLDACSSQLAGVSSFLAGSRPGWLEYLSGWLHYLPGGLESFWLRVKKKTPLCNMPVIGLLCHQALPYNKLVSNISGHLHIFTALFIRPCNYVIFMTGFDLLCANPSRSYCR